MSLAQLLGAMPVAQFMADHYQRFPCARPGGCATVVPDACGLLRRILSGANVDVLFTRGGEIQQVVNDPIAMLDQGYTIRIRHAERHDASLQALADEFHEDFRAAVDVHLYCTPGAQWALGWHYDAEEVFVMQLAGSKKWELRKNTVNPWPLEETMPEDMRFERETTPTIHCTLHAGDWLYVPNGYWHRTAAGEERSTSLSVGIMAHAAIDVFDFVRRRLLADLRWRQRLPNAGRATAATRSELLATYRDIFAGLGQDLDRLFGSREVIEAFLDSQRQ